MFFTSPVSGFGVAACWSSQQISLPGVAPSLVKILLQLHGQSWSFQNGFQHPRVHAEASSALTSRIKVLQRTVSHMTASLFVRKPFKRTAVEQCHDPFTFQSAFAFGMSTDCWRPELSGEKEQKQQFYSLWNSLLLLGPLFLLAGCSPVGKQLWWPSKFAFLLQPKTCLLTSLNTELHSY